MNGCNGFLDLLGRPHLDRLLHRAVGLCPVELSSYSVGISRPMCPILFRSIPSARHDPCFLAKSMRLHRQENHRAGPGGPDIMFFIRGF